MNIYYGYRTDSNEEVFEAMHEIVLIASDETAARKEAVKSSLNEGPGVWLDDEQSTFVELGVANPDADPSFLMRDTA